MLLLDELFEEPRDIAVKMAREKAQKEYRDNVKPEQNNKKKKVEPVAYEPCNDID